MLANFRSDERVALGDFIELLDDHLRLDQRASVVVPQAILALPFLDLAPPGFQGRGIWPLVGRFD